MTRKYALDGGPGNGKSTLLRELSEKGYYTMHEVAEYLIQRGITPQKLGRDSFQNKLLETQLDWEREIPKEIELSFQDSGIPRGIAYYRADGLEPPKRLIQEAKKANYSEVFILDPLQTYENTPIRPETRDYSLKVHEEVWKIYRELGYNPIKLRATGLKDRVDHLLKNLGLSSTRRELAEVKS